MFSLTPRSHPAFPFSLLFSAVSVNRPGCPKDRNLDCSRCWLSSHWHSQHLWQRGTHRCRAELQASRRVWSQTEGPLHHHQGIKVCSYVFSSVRVTSSSIRLGVLRSCGEHRFTRSLSNRRAQKVCGSSNWTTSTSISYTGRFLYQWVLVSPNVGFACLGKCAGCAMVVDCERVTK